jgi:hypothetical protein
MNESSGGHRRGGRGQMSGLAAALLPIPAPNPAELAQRLRSQVKQAACMRAHGYPDSPDPSEQDGHLLRAQLPASIDVNSPRFQSTQEACNKG